MALIYKIILCVITVFIAPILAYLAIIDRWGMRQRLGLIPLISSEGKRHPIVWLHCASVGEATGISAVIDQFVERHPNLIVLVTTMTTSGLDYVKNFVPKAHFSGLVPMDIPFIVNHVFKRIKPRALILLEGELWPSLLNAAVINNCPVALINGRMSDRSISRNRFVKPLFRNMLNTLAAVGVQSVSDGERFIAFGMNSKRVKVTGNVKLDLAVERNKPSREQLRLEFSLPESLTVLIAGCPRPMEEEETVLLAFIEVQKKHPETKLIWAPRHLHRIPKIEEKLKGCRLKYCLRSKIRDIPPGFFDVMILDTIGELASMYAIADIAFVGATLVPLGGHNVLEPAACSIPVLFGPHIQNIRASAIALIQNGGGIIVHNQNELTQTWLDLIQNKQKRNRIGAAAGLTVTKSNKAVNNTLDFVDKWILKPVNQCPLNTSKTFLPFYFRIFNPISLTKTSRFMHYLFLPFSILYGIVIRLRNNLYDSGLLVSDTLSVPVISIGGLTVGGAGKTPLVQYLTEKLIATGYKPAVLSRGYGRTTKGIVLAKPGMNWKDIGDEPAFLASVLPETPIIVGSNRTKLGQIAIERFKANVLLLDDGFQHRKTNRLINVVVIDASIPIRACHLIPAGPFREPLSSLERADILFLTRTDQGASKLLNTQRFLAVSPKLDIIRTTYRPSSLNQLAGGNRFYLEWLSGRDIIVLCGIANPTSFVETIQNLGGRVQNILAYPDHYPFSHSDLDNAMAVAQKMGVSWIITTSKDAVRIQDHPIRNHLIQLNIELNVTSGEEILEKLLSKLDSKT